MNSREVLRRINVVRSRPSRIADALREPRNIVVGNTLLNQLGLQVGRTVGDRLKWSLRDKRSAPDIESALAVVERDGVVVIPNFLPPNAWADVSAEYSDIEARSPYKHISFGENFEARDLLLTDEPGRYPAIMRHIRDNPFLLRLASAVSRRTMTFKPHVSLFKVLKPRPNLEHTDLDYNQYVHADRHYAFVKAFFYMEDVDASTAPYSYARGSHKVDLARLEYEYAYSVEYTKVRKRHVYAPTREQLHINRALCDLATAYLDKIHCRIEPIAASANTMIISNNIGFHCRGPMTGMHQRVTMNIDYKYLESPAHWLFPILKHLYSSNHRTQHP